MSSHDAIPDDGSIISKGTTTSVPRTVELLLQLLSEKDLKVFAVIDQRAEAANVDLELRETVLVIFGNPASGTPVMDRAPLSALDLPLKILIWSDGKETRISYVAPQELARRYRLSDELIGLLSGINAITDGLVLSANGHG